MGKTKEQSAKCVNAKNLIQIGLKFGMDRFMKMCPLSGDDVTRVFTIYGVLLNLAALPFNSVDYLEYLSILFDS